MCGAEDSGIVLVMRALSYCLQRSKVSHSLGGLGGCAKVVAVVPAGVLAATQQQPHNSDGMHATQPRITHKSSAAETTWNPVPMGPGISPPRSMANWPMGEFIASLTA